MQKITPWKQMDEKLSGRNLEKTCGARRLETPGRKEEGREGGNARDKKDRKRQANAYIENVIAPNRRLTSASLSGCCTERSDALLLTAPVCCQSWMP